MFIGDQEPRDWAYRLEGCADMCCFEHVALSL